MPILIVAANLHGGGGAAVAASFLQSVAARATVASNVHVLASSVVDKHLKALGVPREAFGRYFIVDLHGIAAIWTSLPVNVRVYASVFVVFGPLYSLSRFPGLIMGIADPFIVFPSNLQTRRLTLVNRVRSRIMSQLRGLFCARAAVCVVESELVRSALASHMLFRKKQIVVVNSAVDKVYFDSTRWQEVSLPSRSGTFRLGLVSRNYPHKNLAILPPVRRLLRETFRMNVEFCVTFSSQEWEQCSAEFQAEITNVGSLALAQCPSFYQQMDAVIFPSVLECFSATPIEALASRRPLFASNIPAISSTVGAHAHYFDPLNPLQIAEVIYQYFSSDASAHNCEALDRAHSYATERYGSDKRADTYLELCGINAGTTR